MKSTIFFLIFITGYCNFSYSQGKENINCDLGYRWEEEESEGWKGIWIRRGNSDIFEVDYTGSKGQKMKTINKVDLDGKKVHIQRIYCSDGSFCTYEGTINEDGTTINGVYSCPLGFENREWSAKIYCDKNAIFNLQGEWKCSDDATYYIRQIEKNIYWYGKQNKDKPAFANIAYGTLKGDTLKMLWFDVPSGTNMGFGEIVIVVHSNDSFERIKNISGGFGGTFWERIK